MEVNKWSFWLLFVLSIGLSQTDGNAQADISWELRKFDQLDGLSHQHTTCLAQDGRGFIWVGSVSGLNRFDGTSFKTFTTKDGLGSNDIDALNYDGEGFLWVWDFTEQGFPIAEKLSFVNTVTGRVQTPEDRFGLLPFRINQVKSVATGTDGTVLLGCNDGRFIFYTPNKGFQEIDLKAYFPDFSLSNISGIMPIPGDSDKFWIVYNPENLSYVLFSIDSRGNLVSEFHWENNVFPRLAGAEQNGTLWYWYWANEATRSQRICSIGLDGYNICHPPNELVNAEISPSTFLNNFLYICPLDQTIWLTTSTAVHRFDPETGYLQDLNLQSELQASSINNIFFDSQGNAWISTGRGLFLLVWEKTKFKTLLHQEFKIPNKISGVSCRGIGMLNDSILVLNTYSGQFFLHGLQDSSYDHRTDFGLSIVESADGSIWSARKKLEHISLEKTLKVNTIKDLFPTTGRIWSMAWDHTGKIWIGGSTNIGWYDPARDTFAIFDKYNDYSSIRHQGIYHFFEEEKGLFWLSTGNGLYLLDVDSGIIDHKGLFYPKISPNYLPARSIYHLHKDKTGFYWLASGESGLIRYHPGCGDYKVYTTENGLSSNVINAIYEDDQGFLWLSSENGIMRFDRRTENILTWGVKDGISNSEFNRISHYKDKDGRIYFGSVTGLTVFHPDDFLIENDKAAQPISIMSIQTYPQSANGSEEQLAEVLQSGTLTIQPGVQFIQIELGYPYYDTNSHPKFGYRLQGMGNDDWIDLSSNILTFSGLPSGQHLLEVSVRNAKGQFTDGQLAIKLMVKKPLLQRSSFWGSLFIFLLAGSWSVFRYRSAYLIRQKSILENEVAIRTEKIAQDKKTIELQANQLREAEETRSRFIANIAHDIRTPLTLIINPLHKLLKQNSSKGESGKLLSTAYSNSQRLNKLINDLSLLSQLEHDQSKLNLEWHNIANTIESIRQTFQPAAQDKGLIFTANSNLPKQLEALTDWEKLESILQNLISNAIKYTDAGSISLYAEYEGENLNLIVSDTGPGIVKEDQELIFNRYSRSKTTSGPERSGFGLGLAICREYSRILGGRIFLSSTPGKGSTFTLSIPCTTRFVEEHPAHSITENTTPKHSQGAATDWPRKPHVLIAEDHFQIREYLISILTNKYKVSAVEDGEEALHFLQSHPVGSVDLVLTDLIMPHLNGLELLNTIKSTPQFMYIPVLLITGLNSKPSELEAIRIGVDDYMRKPFLENELHLRIQNLLSNHFRRLAFTGNTIDSLKQSADHPEMEGSEILSSNLSLSEMQWLSEFERRVRNSISEPTFGLDMISTELELSSRQLQRRIKKLTGLSPNMYIRELRLQEARKLMDTSPDLLVKNIAKEVGFMDSTYFSNLFKKRFGLSPSEYMSS